MTLPDATFNQWCGISRVTRRAMLPLMTAVMLASAPICAQQTPNIVFIVADNLTRAHVSDSGMDYRNYEQWSGVPCCRNYDCMPVPYYHGKNGNIVIFPFGYRAEVPWSKVNPKRSTDNRAHWCGHIWMLKRGQWRQFVSLLTMCVILPPEAV